MPTKKSRKIHNKNSNKSKNSNKNHNHVHIEINTAAKRQQRRRGGGAKKEPQRPVAIYPAMSSGISHVMPITNKAPYPMTSLIPNEQPVQAPIKTEPVKPAEPVKPTEQVAATPINKGFTEPRKPAKHKPRRIEKDLDELYDGSGYEELENRMRKKKGDEETNRWRTQQAKQDSLHSFHSQMPKTGDFNEFDSQDATARPPPPTRHQSPPRRPLRFDNIGDAFSAINPAAAAAAPAAGTQTTPRNFSTMMGDFSLASFTNLLDREGIAHPKITGKNRREYAMMYCDKKGIKRPPV